MMRWVGVGIVILGVAGAVGAGELELANGSRLQGELANEVLIVSTGSDLVEVLPEQVGQLTPGEVRLKDGRVLRGAIVGGRVKMRTPLGEIAVKADELRFFRVDGFVPGAGAATPAAVPAGAPAPTALPAVTTKQPAELAVPPTEPRPAAAPPAAASRAPAPPARSADTSVAVPAPAATATVVVPNGSVGRAPSPEPPEAGRTLEVLAAGPLYRDAVENANTVGDVTRGEKVTLVDFIDRRLRIFDTVILDGGYWLKVRAGDGTEGWLPANTLRAPR